MVMVVGLVALLLAGSDPADDAPPPAPAPAPAPPSATIERGPPDDEEEEDDDGPPPSMKSPTTTPPTTPPTTDPADPADPAPPPTTTAPSVTTTAPSAGDPLGPADPADAEPAPTPAARDPQPRRAPPEVRAITRSPSPDLRHPVVAGGIVAGAGCIASLAPVAGFVACPYSFVAAPLTACCGTVGAAAVTEAQHDDGDPVGSSIAAAVGVTAATAVGAAGGAGLALLTGNAQNGIEIVFGAVGGLVAMAIIGPLAGGGAVAAYKSFSAPTTTTTMTKAP